MMRITELSDKNVIYGFLKKNPEINLYLIGDLDDFFMPRTKWYALEENGEIISLALLYSGGDIPTLLCFRYNDPSHPALLLNELRPVLPAKFYAHLSTGLAEILGEENILEAFGRDYRMILRTEAAETDNTGIRSLTRDDDSILRKLYSVSYPSNWYDPRMLETGYYLGFFSDSILAGAAGVHVVSEEYSIAALGNIATLPGRRGEGIAFKLTSALCRNLSLKISTIGLNVRADNIPAVTCYRKAGFEISGDFEEYLIRNC